MYDGSSSQSASVISDGNATCDKYRTTDYNQLTALPELPVLTILNCSDNQLTVLPELPVLTKLWCSHNQLTALPELPPSLTHLGCKSNPFETRTTLTLEQCCVEFINEEHVECARLPRMLQHSIDVYTPYASTVWSTKNNRYYVECERYTAT